MFQSKNIKVFQWLPWIQFFGFLTKVKAKNGNEKKKQTFFQGTYSNVSNIFLSKTVKVSQWFQNQSLWLKWTQTVKMKQNHTFSMGHIQIWHHFSSQKWRKQFQRKSFLHLVSLCKCYRKLDTFTTQKFKTRS